MSLLPIHIGKLFWRQGCGVGRDEGFAWAFRGLAPTNLPLAGAVAATLYCLYCEAVSPLYIFTRYTSGIGLATIAGMLLGRRILRW